MRWGVVRERTEIACAYIEAGSVMAREWRKVAASVEAPEDNWASLTLNEKDPPEYLGLAGNRADKHRPVNFTMK